MFLSKLRLFSNKRRILSIRNISTVEAPLINNEGTNKMSVEEKRASILTEKDYFNVHNIFTVKEMYSAKVHFGHKEVSLNEGMKPFLFGSRLGQIIFDLDITAYHLRKALNFCAHIAYRGGIILFVSHNKRASLIVENTAKECKEFAYTREWRRGVLTNSKSLFQFEIRLPDLCIFLNTKFETGQEHLGVIEASKLLIPTIAVVDSDCSPNIITYPVPGNDDSPSSVSFFCNVFKTAILRGKNELKKDLELLKT